MMADPHEQKERLVEERPFPELEEWTAWLPVSFCHEEVVAMATDFQAQGAQEPISERLTSGPAIRWAAVAFVGLWLTHLVLPLPAFYLSDCTVHAYATCSVLCMVYSIPVIFALYLVELQAFRTSIVNQAQTVGAFQFIAKLPFYPWLVIATGFSLLDKLDIVFSGIFLATSLKTHLTCPEESLKFDALWRDVLQQSALRFIPFVVDLPLCYLALLMWVLMLWQPGHAILEALPRSMSEVDYDLGTKEEAVDMARGKKEVVQKWTYRTILEDKMNHGRVLQVLARTGRLVLVTDQDPRCTKVKVKHRTGKGDVAGACNLVLDAIAFWRSKILVRGLLENAFKLNLQVSIMAMTVYAERGEVQMQVLATLLVSCLTSLKTFAEASLFLKGALVSRAELEALTQRVAQDKQAGREVLWKSWVSPQDVLEKYIPKMKQNLAWFAAGYVLYGMAIFYAYVKFVAVFTCRDSMINVTGCADLMSDTPPFPS